MRRVRRVCTEKRSFISMVSTAARPSRKQPGLCSKVVALALSCGLMLFFCHPSQAFASTNDQLVSSMLSTVEAIVSASLSTQAEEDDPTSKTLVYDTEAVVDIGTQVETGHTSCCLAFSQAIGDTIMTGETIDHTEYASYGNCAWSPCASYGDWTESADDLAAVYYEINAGRPVVMFVTGSGFSHHWVLAIGYCGVEDPSVMSLDNVVIIDPWDGASMIASERFSCSGAMELTSKTATVAK